MPKKLFNRYSMKFLPFIIFGLLLIILFILALNEGQAYESSLIKFLILVIVLGFVSNRLNS